ncbi:MAG: hypothetical protein JWR25_2021 [Noviherbaspirillum sp.]|jgi:hypothetical protein|nr:hypothetical protein [Noviherbaspirillum sp.]
MSPAFSGRELRIAGETEQTCKHSRALCVHVGGLDGLDRYALISNVAGRVNRAEEESMKRVFAVFAFLAGGISVEIVKPMKCSLIGISQVGMRATERRYGDGKL